MESRSLRNVGSYRLFLLLYNIAAAFKKVYISSSQPTDDEGAYM